MIISGGFIQKEQYLLTKWNRTATGTYKKWSMQYKRWSTIKKIVVTLKVPTKIVTLPKVLSMKGLTLYVMLLADNSKWEETRHVTQKRLFMYYIELNVWSKVLVQLHLRNHAYWNKKSL